MVGREYEYRLQAGRVLTRAILMGVGAAFLAYLALTNDRGLVLFIIPLSKDAATISYWVFAGLAALFAVCDAVTVDRRGDLKQRIAFSEAGLLVPKSATSSEETLIPYDSVVDIKPFREPDTVAVIRHRDGEFTLRLDMLPNERDFAEIVQELAVQAQAAKVGSAAATDSPKPG